MPVVKLTSSKVPSRRATQPLSEIRTHFPHCVLTLHHLACWWCPTNKMISSCVAPVSSEDFSMVDRLAAAAARADGKKAHGQAARNVDVAWESTGIGQQAAFAHAFYTGASSARTPVLCFAADAALLRLSKTATEAVHAASLAGTRGRHRWCACHIRAAARETRMRLVQRAHKFRIRMDMGNVGDVGVVGVVDHHRR